MAKKAKMAKMATKPVIGTMCVLAVAFQAVLASSAAPARLQTTSASGVYTEAQATRGEALYADNCSYCHLNDLSGGDLAPALAGPGFVARWSTRSLGELFDYMRSVMPLNSPGGLSAQQNADLLAFILRRADYPPGAKELPASTEALDPIALAARP